MRDQRLPRRRREPTRLAPHGRHLIDVLGPHDSGRLPPHILPLLRRPGWSQLPLSSQWQSIGPDAGEPSPVVRLHQVSYSFEAHKQGGRAVGLHPNLDLAVVAFPAGRAPLWANVLFSREHPAGVVADIDGRAGAPRNLRFDGDITDANGDSIAWQPGTDWSALRFPPLAGAGPLRFVAPYPASLLKLMVAVGVGLAVDRGLAAWPEALEPMITVSDNDATDLCVKLLHQTGVIAGLNRRFADLGLRTLQLNDTTPAGGWRNRDGSGVGHIHMSAWDTARLLWLDWKLFGGPEGQPPLKKHELDAWLRFGFDTLVRACPHDVRIVSYLAMHVEEKNQKRLRDDLELVKQKLISDQFRAFLLPALPRVDHSELVEFLTEPDNTTCPPSLATQIASLIYRDTDGIYDKTVKHIETAERSGWGSLLTELSRRHGLLSSPSHDDETY